MRHKLKNFYTLTCRDSRAVQDRVESSIEHKLHQSIESVTVMGKRKIEIKLIEDRKTRGVTYRKRKQGFFKKGSELATLSGSDVVIVCIPHEVDTSPSIYCSNSDRNWFDVVRDAQDLLQQPSPPKTVPKRSRKRVSKRAKTDRAESAQQPQPPPITQPTLDINLDLLPLNSFHIQMPQVTLEVSPRRLRIWPRIENSPINTRESYNFR